MKFECSFLAILVFVSSVKCLYIQEAHEMPHIQALARIGERPASAVPGERTVIVVPNSGTSSQYRTYPAYPNTYGTNGVSRGSTVVINVAEDQDPYYAAPVPTRTVRI